MATMRASLPRWLGPGSRGYRRADGQPYRPRNPDEYTELLCRLHPVGTPEHCLNTLTGTTCRTGIDHVILLVEGAGDRACALENITASVQRSCPCCKKRLHAPEADVPAVSSQVEAQLG